jgi:hypothetical protein
MALPDSTRSITVEDVLRFFATLATPEAAGLKLMKDNRKYRERARAGDFPGKAAMEEELREAQGEAERLRGMVLPAGHKAVPDADAALLESYKKLGKPEEVAEGLKKKGELETEKAERERLDSYSGIAGRNKLKGKLLARLAKAENFEVMEREEDADDDSGEKVKVAYARVAGDEKAPWVKLSKFVDSHLSDYATALREDGAEADGDTTRRAGGSSNNGVEFPRQKPAGGRAPSKDAVSAHVQSTYVAPSKLRETAKTEQ